MLNELTKEMLVCESLMYKTVDAVLEDGGVWITYELLYLKKGRGVYILRVDTEHDEAIECISNNSDEAESIFERISNGLVTPCGLYDSLHEIKNSI